MRRVTLAVPALLAGCANSAPAESATATPAGPGRYQGPVDIGGGRHLYLSCSGKAWPELQQDLIALRPGTPHPIATGSDIQVSNPDLVADTALLVIRRIAS